MIVASLVECDPGLGECLVYAYGDDVHRRHLGQGDDLTWGIIEVSDGVAQSSGSLEIRLVLP